MRKRMSTGAALVLLVAALLVPASPAPAQTGLTFAGKTSGRALDLAVPALNVNPTLASTFKGLTLGATHLEVSSNPAASGFAAGRCDLLPSNAGPSNLPCSGDSLEKSSISSDNTSDGDSNAKCLGAQAISTVVSISASCGRSFATASGGIPAGINEAGVADFKLGLDLSAFNATIESAKDTLVNTIEPLVTQVIGQVPGAVPLTQAQKDELKASLGQFFTSLRDGAQAGRIKVGNSVSEFRRDGTKLILTSTSQAASIGFFGLTDALTDGLIIIEVGPSKVQTIFDSASGVGTGTVDPAIATIRVRDFLGLDPSNYITIPLPPTNLPLQLNGALSTALSAVKGTLLETTIEVASSSVSAPGRSVTASSSGVSVHALKGIGSATAGSLTSCGSCDGGVILRLSTAAVSFSGALPETNPPPLPVTGGRTPFFLAMMAVLGTAGVALYLSARRLRAAAR